MSEWLETLRGGQALARLLRMSGIKSVLDIGSGVGHHAEIMRSNGFRVTTISLCPPADYLLDFMELNCEAETFDAIWASHVLEHQLNTNAFLIKCWLLLKPGGVLAVTVPPAKHNIVGGHVTLWNAGLLIYQLILAGFDCSQASVGTYGYNISVLVRKGHLQLPKLNHDSGDITKLAGFFPCHFEENFSGELPDIRW